MEQLKTVPGGSPAEVLARVWRKIPRYIKVTFAAAMVAGLVCHLYMMTNYLPNHDNSLANDFRWTWIQGRWFSFIPSMVSGDFALPLVNGLLAVGYIAVAACLVAYKLRVRRALYCVLLASLMVAFPTVTGTFTYLIYVDFMMFSLLLACLAVIVAEQGKVWGLLLGGVMLACSLGIYQSYITVAAAFAVGILVMNVLHEHQRSRDVILKGVKFLGMLGLGLLLYFGMVRITSASMKLTDYQGLSAMGRVSLEDIPVRLWAEAKGLYRFFFAMRPGLHPRYASVLYIIVFAAGILLGLRLLLAVRLRLTRGQIFLVFGLLAIFCVACGSVYLMGANTVYVNMQYALVMLPLLCLAVCQWCEEQTAAQTGKTVWIQYGASWLVVLALVGILHSYVLLSNAVYLKMGVVYEQGYAYSVELNARIHSAPGYTQDTPVLFAGTPGASIETEPAFEQIRDIIGANENLPASYSYVHFLKAFLGTSYPDTALDNEALAALYSRPEYAKMPVYPAQGSIQMMDGVLVVKFAEMPLQAQ